MVDSTQGEEIIATKYEMDVSKLSFDGLGKFRRYTPQKLIQNASSRIKVKISFYASNWLSIHIEFNLGNSTRNSGVKLDED